jgi:hypothetical protein
VTLDEKASVALRPGMTAEVEILVDSLKDVLAVPVQAVAEHRGHHFVYGQGQAGFERREVEVGATNNRMIVIREGIQNGDVVALDARRRTERDFADDEDLESDDMTKLAADVAAEASTDAAKEAATEEEPAAEKSGEPESTPTAPTPPAEEPATASPTPAETTNVPVEPADQTSDNTVTETTAASVSVADDAVTSTEAAE